MAGLPTKADLAAQVAAFAERVAPAIPRWEYAFKAAAYPVDDRFGKRTCFNTKSFASLARFLGGGIDAASVGYRLGQIEAHAGVEGARAAYYGRQIRQNLPDPYRVGPVEPWQVGHVYFARLAAFPHVSKVGFSRRVNDRIEEIEGKSGRLAVEAVKVGTLADEHWWHHSWRSLHISGEWYFWPRSNDRSLPPFLARAREAA
jgi:hypothetical protein